jgi:hypothetical protein
MRSIPRRSKRSIPTDPEPLDINRSPDAETEWPDVSEEESESISEGIEDDEEEEESGEEKASTISADELRAMFEADSIEPNRPQLDTPIIDPQPDPEPPAPYCQYPDALIAPQSAQARGHQHPRPIRPP